MIGGLALARAEALLRYLGLVLALAIGCRDGGKDGACAGGQLIEADSVAAALDPTVETFATVSLTLASTADVTVWATAEGAPDVAGPARPDQDGEIVVPLRGLRPETTYEVHVRADAEDGCDEGSVELTTGALPGTPPEMDVLVDDGTHTGFVMAATSATGDGTKGFSVLDRGGVPVWNWTTEGTLGAMHFVDRAADGDGFLVLFSETYDAGSHVMHVGWDGEVVSDIPVPGAHHSLTQKVPGVAFATLVQETREVPGFAEFCDVETDTVIGDTVVEVAEDGTITEVWNAFDDWEPGCHNAMGILTDVVGNDWTHLNAIDYDAVNDDWLLSFYWFGQLAVIDRATRAPVYRIGDFDGADCRTELARQHGAEFTDVGIALFDNNHAPAARMLELELDPEAGKCRVDTEVAHPDGLRASTLGDVDVVDGRWYTAWGDDGDVMVIDEGEVVWRALRSEEFFEDHGGFIALSVAYLPDLYPPGE